MINRIVIYMGWSVYLLICGKDQRRRIKSFNFTPLTSLQRAILQTRPAIERLPTHSIWRLLSLQWRFIIHDGVCLCYCSNSTALHCFSIFHRCLCGLLVLLDLCGLSSIILVWPLVLSASGLTYRPSERPPIPVRKSFDLTHAKRGMSYEWRPRHF